MYKTYIIAEAGVNHNGSLDIAKKLVDIAVEAGADAVKFQTFKTENMVTGYAEKAKYQEDTTGTGSQFEMLKKLELSFDDHYILNEYCKEQGITFLSTPFDFSSVDLLEKTNIPFYKISSGDLTNIPFLQYIAKLNKPMIVSTGMANLGEIEAAINSIKECGNDKITLLHCTSNYPTTYEDVNLNAMLTMKESFKLPVGYSDHTIGIEVSIAAVSMGAKIIEKHFTLDKNMQGPDHRASLDPRELKSMVSSIRNIENAFGDGIKKCCKSEENSKITGRKSIVAKIDLMSGEELSFYNIAFKRPGNGISPACLNEILGKKVLSKVKKDDTILSEKLSR